MQSKLYLNKPHFSKKSLVFRSMRSLDAESFRTDIANCSLCHDLPDYDINALVNLYDSELHAIIDAHTPLKYRTIIQRPNSP